MKLPGTQNTIMLIPNKKNSPPTYNNFSHKFVVNSHKMAVLVEPFRVFIDNTR